MQPLRSAFGLTVTTGIALGSLNLSTSAEDGVRGIGGGTPIRGVASSAGASSAPAAASRLGPGGCPFPVWPPPTVWCATNEANEPQPPNDTICAISDATDPGGGYRVADDLWFSSAVMEVFGLTWWGTLCRLEGSEFLECDMDVLPPSEDNWTIRYYEDDDGRPGTLITEFVGVGPGVASGDYSRVALEEEIVVPGVGSWTKMEMTYFFDDADVLWLGGLQRYWIEIYSDYANDCFFCWQTSNPNWNLYSLQAEVDEPYDPMWANEFDMAQCQCAWHVDPNPRPTVRMELVDPTPVDQDQCCHFRYVVENQYFVGAGPVTKFYMAVHRGDHSDPDCGEDLSEITPPPGYTVSYCEGWRTRELGDSRWVIYQFDPIGDARIPELSEVFGSLRVRVNDERANDLHGEYQTEIVPAFGIRAWGTDRTDLGEAYCGTGANFDPLWPPIGWPQWSVAGDGTCTNEGGDPLRPIPAGTALGKGLLAMLLVGAGAWLVMRSRAPMA